MTVLDENGGEMSEEEWNRCEHIPPPPPVPTRWQRFKL